MNRLKFRSPLHATLGLALFLHGGTAWAQTAELVTGDYQRLPIQNGWHEGTISVKQGGAKEKLEWKNKAGAKWNLIPDFARGVLITDETNPYFKTGTKEIPLEIEEGKVIGFDFNGDHFSRVGIVSQKLPQKSGGLKGYISMSMGKVEAGHGFGVSFYVAAWPLLEKPLAGFQVGLPSTWVIPDNLDFTQPLCPPGTLARDNWPERGPYYRDVFQTIEGGLGFWGSTQFGSGTPKYRMNGTPDGYNHEVSSPGWGFGRPAALAPDKVGIAQLSNRLLVPPDGLTFKEGTAGELLGNAWMALPLTTAKTEPGAPTGDQSWTLFLNAANFKGPVAFWIPDTWSQLSQGYRAIDGRGLDARPALMHGGAMEVNTVPYFEAKDAKGVRYTRIPKLQFPMNARGESVLMQDVVMYSQAALYDPLKTAAPAGRATSWKFDPRAGFRPTLKANAISLKQGEDNILLGGIEKQTQTAILGQAPAQAFALKWSRPDRWGALPEYYREDGKQMAAISAEEVPAETSLTKQKFKASTRGQPYTAPQDTAGPWRKPGPKPGAYSATLTDGSVITYAWYRFVDQPAIMAKNWTEAERTRLQFLIERLHAQWPINGDYIPAPSTGNLVTLDPSLVVTPPKGMEVGYVPIVIRQSQKP